MEARCFGGWLNHRGHVVVFYSNPGHSLSKQVLVKMMWSAGALLLLFSSQSLLEAFVMQSALFVQLEISPGLPQHPPPHIQELTAGDHFLGFLELSHAASELEEPS